MIYHVICGRPGLHRGGRPNPPHAPYKLGDHTPDQLRDLLAEPATHVIIGAEMTEDDVAKIEADLAAAAEAAEKKKPAKAG